MKLIIAGGRDATYFNVLTAIEECESTGPFNPYDVHEVVCGCAKGADMAGNRWATLNGIPVVYFHPDWEGDGKAAGHIRNRKMGDYATHLLAVWDGKSKGTKGMIEYATKK